MSVASDKLANVSALLSSFESAASTLISSRSNFEGLKSSLSSALDDLKVEFSNSVVAAEAVAPVAAPAQVSSGSVLVSQ